MYVFAHPRLIAPKEKNVSRNFCGYTKQHTLVSAPLVSCGFLGNWRNQTIVVCCYDYRRVRCIL